MFHVMLGTLPGPRHYPHIKQRSAFAVRSEAQGHQRQALVVVDDEPQAVARTEGGGITDRAAEGASMGDGGPASARGAGPGHGLVGMRERVAMLGGDFDAAPAAGGFTVQARLPVAAPAAP